MDELWDHLDLTALPTDTCPMRFETHGAYTMAWCALYIPRLSCSRYESLVDYFDDAVRSGIVFG